MSYISFDPERHELGRSVPPFLMGLALPRAVRRVRRAGGDQSDLVAAASRRCGARRAGDRLQLAAAASTTIRHRPTSISVGVRGRSWAASRWVDRARGGSASLRRDAGVRRRGQSGGFDRRGRRHRGGRWSWRPRRSRRCSRGAFEGDRAGGRADRPAWRGDLPPAARARRAPAVFANQPLRADRSDGYAAATPDRGARGTYGAVERRRPHQAAPPDGGSGGARGCLGWGDPRRASRGDPEAGGPGWGPGVVGDGGFEPPTSSLSATRSNRLS